MPVYRLWVQLESGWENVCAVEAPDPGRALEEASLLLRPEHRNKLHRLLPDPPRPQPPHDPNRANDTGPTA